MQRPISHPRSRLRHLPACMAIILAGSAPALTLAAAQSVGAHPIANGRLFSQLAKARRATAAPGPRADHLTADSVVVTSCEDDGGFDTLRHAALVANSGDTIELGGLPCSTITLQAGAIAVALDDLKIVGPGAGKLTIDGGNAGRVFVHSGAGTLTLQSLTVANGSISADKAYGGCIFTKGNVTLDNATVTACTALGQIKSAGGAIIAYGYVNLNSSVLSNSSAIAAVGVTDDLSAAGGGAVAIAGLGLLHSVVSGNLAQAPTGKAYAGGLLTSSLLAKYSTISGNQALSAGDTTQYGAGGALAASAATIIASTIDHNTADAIGGVFLSDNIAASSIDQSTISSNTGTLAVGALQVNGPITLRNSTIAFNTAGALAAVGAAFNGSAQLEGSIIADNSSTDVIGTTITGGKNILKIVGAGTTVPMDTSHLDPKLEPLAFNGGPTRTHALGPASPAINAGAATSSYDFDQRGPSYARIVGANADIGAFEVDPDHIFGTAFEYPLVNL